MTERVGNLLGRLQGSSGQRLVQNKKLVNHNKSLIFLTPLGSPLAIFINLEMAVRDHVVQFLTDERGGAALEFALVSAFAAFMSLASIAAVQKGWVPLLPDVQAQIMQAVEKINAALP